MSDESKTRDVIDAVVGVAKAIPVYQDVVQPAAQELGIALQTVAKTVHIALAPVSALVWGYDQIRDFVSSKVAERLRSVKPDDIVPPKPNVAGPALEALRYTGHASELSDLYANLLAASMDRNSAAGAHPAFVEIIKQFTPDEAKLLAYVIEPRALPLLDVRWEYKNQTPENTGGQDVFINFSLLGVQAALEYPGQTPTYINNLCRLGLAEIPASFQYTALGVYEPLEQSPEVATMKATIEKNPEWSCTLQRKGLRITPLGRQFASICVVRKGASSC